MIYIYFNLKKDTEIEASPTELTFEAEGGEQTVNVDKKSYPYCGGFTDSDCEDWITIKNVSDGVFTVTAAPNNTDKERTGTIYAFATNSMNPTKDDIVLLPIKVKQKAGDTSGDTSQQQQITQVEISSFKFKTNLVTNCTQNHYNEKGKLDKTEEYVVKRIVRKYDNNRIVIVKPKQFRYWIKSIALRDADDTFADITEYYV